MPSIFSNKNHSNNHKIASCFQKVKLNHISWGTLPVIHRSRQSEDPLDQLKPNVISNKNGSYIWTFPVREDASSTSPYSKPSSTHTNSSYYKYGVTDYKGSATEVLTHYEAPAKTKFRPTSEYMKTPPPSSSCSIFTLDSDDNE